MTKNEAKNLIIRNNAEWVWYETIDKIFDEFGEKLQDKDDEIELLKCRIEEAMKPKTCEGCKHKPNDGECYYEPCGTCARFFYDHYEPKVTP
ncbi:MAG: hypothetical protein ACMV1K_10345 [Sulfurospirillum sp.]